MPDCAAVCLVLWSRKQRQNEYRRREVLMMPGELAEDKLHAAKFYERSPINNSEKLLATPDSLSYSTYHSHHGVLQPQQRPLAATDARASVSSARAVPVQIPETPSLYYGQEEGNFPSPHSREHLYEYPAFVGPVSGAKSQPHNKTDAAP